MSNPSPFEGLPEATAKDLSKNAFPSGSIEPPSVEHTLLGSISSLPLEQPDAPSPARSQSPTGTFLQVPGSADSVGRHLADAKEVAVPPEYVVLGELGRGGMGVVYKARHKRLNRIVALKMILSGSHASHDELVRFLAEAEAVAALSHPNIVQLFESGQHEGRPYFTLEYVAGGSLGTLVKDHPLKGDEAARIVEQIARGMDYAHQQGIVHRDLKPENILLTPESGSVHSETGKSTQTAEPSGASSSRSQPPAARLPKITDFGLAKKGEGGSGLTATGAVMGTPSYMAPEQAKGDLKNVGPLADVYAVGAILYRLIAGRPPFQAATVMETVMQVLDQEPVPPREFSTEISRDLETICLKCLQKEPAKRYASCGELADDLKRYLNGEPIHARPVGVVERLIRWGRRNPGEAVLLASIVIILVAATALSTMLSIRASRNEAEAVKLAKIARDNEMEAVRAITQVQESNRKTENLFYATRINLAYREWLGGNSKRANQNLDECPEPLRGWEWDFLRSLESVQSVELRGHEEHVYQGVFFLGGKQAMTIGKAGTMRYWDTQLGTQFDQGPPGVQLIAVSPDQKVYVGATDALLFLRDLETGRLHFEYPLPDGPLAAVQFVQNGKKIASVSRRGQVRLHAVGTGKQEFESNYLLSFDPAIEVLNRQVGGNLLAFNGDGTRVAYGSRDSRVRVTNVATGELLLDGKDHFGLVERVVYHPTRDVVASAGQDGVVRLWDVPVKRICHELKGHPNFVHALAFSPDGRLLVSGGKDQTVRVWEWETEDNKMVLRGHTADVLSASFDATGRFVITGSVDATARVWDLQERVYTSPEVEKFFAGQRIRTFSRVGSQEYLKFFGHGGGGGRLAFSPDGELAATSGLADPASKEQVVVWNLDERKEVKKLPIFGRMLHSPVFSADGKSLLVASSGGQTPDPGELRLFDTTTWEQRWKWEGPLCLELTPAFSPDGKRVVATSAIVGAGRNYLIAWDAGTGREVYRQPAEERMTHGGFAADGTEFLFAGVGSGMVYVHDAATGERKREWRASGSKLLDLACSPTGKLCAIANQRGGIDLWDLAKQEKVRTLEGHTEVATGLVFSPDGTRLFSGGLDLTARLWQVETGYELLTFRDHQNAVQQVAWAGNGGKIGSLSADGALRVWEAPSRAAPPDTSEWELLHRDDFRSEPLEKHWHSLEGVWEARDGKVVGRLVPQAYRGQSFGVALLRLKDVELPRTFEAKVKFKTPQPMSIGIALTDPRTKRSFIPTVNESDHPNGKPSTHVQQVSLFDSTLRMVPIDHWQKYTLAPSETHEFRLIRQEATLRLFVDGVEQFIEPISRIDLPLLSLQAGGANADLEIEFSDFELRAPREAIGEQALRTRVVRLFDEVGFKDGVRESLRRDAGLSEEDRELVEQVLQGLIEDPWKMLTSLKAKLGNENLSPGEVSLLLKQAEFLEKLDPHEWQFVLHLGLAQYRGGQVKEAVDTLKRSIELHRSDQGSAQPVQYAYLAMALDQRDRKEARETARRMTDLLEWSDHWNKDEGQRRGCEEARRVFEAKEDAEVAKVKRLVTRTEQDGWVGHKLDEYLAAHSPTYVQRRQARETPSPSDFELNYEQVKAIRTVQFDSLFNPDLWIDFDELEVKIDGDKAALTGRETVHFSRGFQVYRVHFDLARVGGEWKITRLNSWQLAERIQGTVVIKGEGWWKEQGAILDKLKTENDPVKTARRLNEMVRYQELVEFVGKLPPNEVVAELFQMKGESLFELGRLPEAMASFREATARNPSIDLPWYFSPVKRHFRFDNASGVAWLPDGRSLVGAGGDRRIRVWNVATGQETSAFEPEEAPVLGIDVSPDGERLVVALGNGTIHVRDVKTTRSVARWEAHAKGVYRVAFDRAGKRIVSASADRTAVIWDAETGRMLDTLTGHQDEVLAPEFSPDGTRVATAGHDRSARIWDAQTGREVTRLVGHANLVKCMIWSSDGTRLFTASTDQTARAWDAETGKEICQFTGHANGLDALALSNDGALLATTDLGGAVRLWDAKSGKLLRAHQRLGGAIHAVRFSPDQRFVATAGRDGGVVYATREFPALEEKKTP
jgi:eukaryotic-like serine/threonine-protein kinase